MDKIEWCAGKREGLGLIKPNQNLAMAYFKKAEEALESMQLNKVRDWKITTAYYAIYFSLYALLMRIGVKCEIHSCTVEFAKQFLSEYFGEEEIGLVQESLKARIDSQYYVNRVVSEFQYQEMAKFAPEFMVKCKSVLPKLDERKIKEIRKKFGEKAGLKAAPSP